MFFSSEKLKISRGDVEEGFNPGKNFRDKKLSRVVIDARVVAPGQGHGISTYTEHLVKNLALLPAKMKFFILVTKHSPFFDVNWPSHIHLVTMRTHWLNLFLGQIELCIVLLKLKPDLVHSPSFVVPMLNNAKLVTTIHDLNHVVLAENYTIFHRIYYNLLLVQKIRKARKVITVSHFSKFEILRFFKLPEATVKVIYNGVSKQFCTAVNFERERLDYVREKYELPEKFVFTSGNRKPHKNLKNFIGVYCKSDFDIPLVVLSDFDQTFLDESVRHKKQHMVHFLRYVDLEDLPYIYSLSAVFVFTSLYEGFGLPPLEAFACDTKVVVSNKTSLPEILPKSAIFVDPLNPEEICEGLKTALNSTIQKTPSDPASKREWLQNFEWKKTALETQQIYNEVLAGEL